MKIRFHKYITCKNKVNQYRRQFFKLHDKITLVLVTANIVMCTEFTYRIPQKLPLDTNFKNLRVI